MIGKPLYYNCEIYREARTNENSNATKDHIQITHITLLTNYYFFYYNNYFLHILTACSTIKY